MILNSMNIPCALLKSTAILYKSIYYDIILYINYEKTICAKRNAERCLRETQLSNIIKITVTLPPAAWGLLPQILSFHLFQHLLNTCLTFNQSENGESFVFKCVIFSGILISCVNLQHLKINDSLHFNNRNYTSQLQN